MTPARRIGVVLTSIASIASWAASPVIAQAAADAPEAAPPPITITLVPSAPRLLLGKDTELAVAMDVRGPNAESYLPVRAVANVGTLEMPHADGQPGHFVARYLPPGERFPQVALLVVELASGARRMHVVARVVLEGSTVVPFHSSVGASVTMRVADRNFGPVVADRQGRAEIPIQVPPGIRAGLARAVDHAGAARETEVDLQQAPYPRVLVLAPSTLDVGSFSEITLLGVDPDGTPANPTRLTLGASAGLLHPLGAGAAGEARFLFEAPRLLGSGAVALTAMAAGSPPSRTDMAVALRVGTAAKLVISPSTHKLVVGSKETARVAISAHDAFGNPTAATGVELAVDGQPRPFSTGGGLGTLTVDAPAKFDGRDRITIAARLGTIRASEDIHVTGGSPARLTIDVREPRLVGDGHRGTEVRVQAVDKNGTPTAVPGLSWDTPDGRVRHVRMPRDGEYVAEYVPDRTRERQRQVVAVMASQALRADVTLDVTPPPIRVVTSARVGLFFNFGHAVGPAVFVEALRPVGVRRLPFPFFLGATIGYLHTEIGGAGSNTSEPARLEIDEAPVMALARARIPLPLRVEISAEIGAGVMVARTRLTALSQAVGFEANGRAYAPAFAAGAEAAFTLKPGRLFFGLRYLLSELGRTSQGDEITGNSAGLIGDIGYRMTF